MTNADAAHKITRAHHSRKAVVYLRQSSLAQVKHNTESQRLQYALADTAKLYGFRHIEVIDRDLGLSAASGAPAREGFKELLASIALGEVGLVLSRELSRLARTDQDWCHLMELCRVFDTLLGDAENLYDLSRLDDQLVLGIKGTLSVVELGRCLAPGYVFDAAGHIVKDPNLRVQEAIGLVFGKFNEVASIRQTYRWFHEAEVELPVNKALGGRFVLAWRVPTTMSFVGEVLHNPLYAGAYVYGRRPLNVVFEHGQARKKQRSALAAEDAKVFIPHHHEGYIAWDAYQRNQAIMRGNRGNFVADDAALAVRAGQGLLSGL